MALLPTANRASIIASSANEILLPRTDAGAGVQVIVVVVAMIVLGVLVRRERSLVMLVIGVGFVTLGLMGMRTLH